VSGNKGSDVKSQLRFLLVAIHIDHGNIEAWEVALTGWLMSSDEKQRLFKSIVWSQDQQPVMALLGPFFNRDLEDQLPSDRFRLAKMFRRAYLSGNPATVSSLISKVKKDELALLNVPALASVALYQQGESTTLFSLASRMLKHEPVCPDAFFVGGMYYLSIRRFDIARKFFSKAKGSVHGWIGYGLAFSFSDESGHAISAFRSATVMYPKCVFPWLYAGIESIRTNELKLAQSFLISALALCDADNTGTESKLRGLVLNEIGMICLKAEQFDIAAENMRLCCQLSEEIPNPFLSVMLSNLGHAMLKIRDMDGAVKAFEMAIKHNRSNGNALAGLGYCHHCRGNLSRAIDLYSTSLYHLGGNRKVENLVNNLIQLGVNEYSFSVKQSTVVPPQDEEAIVLNAF
jgi:anaphase-promoting complex subunit 6